MCGEPSTIASHQRQAIVEKHNNLCLQTLPVLPIEQFGPTAPALSPPSIAQMQRPSTREPPDTPELPHQYQL